MSTNGFNVYAGDDRDFGSGRRTVKCLKKYPAIGTQNCESASALGTEGL